MPRREASRTVRPHHVPERLTKKGCLTGVSVFAYQRLPNPAVGSFLAVGCASARQTQVGLAAMGIHRDERDAGDGDGIGKKVCFEAI